MIDIDEPMFMFRCECTSRHEGWYFASQEGTRCVSGHLFHLVAVPPEMNTHRTKSILVAMNVLDVHESMAQQLLLQVLWINLSDHLGKTVTDAERLYGALYWIIEGYGVPGLMEVIGAARELDDETLHSDLFWNIHVKFPWFTFVPEGEESAPEWQVKLTYPVLETVLINLEKAELGELPDGFSSSAMSPVNRLDYLENLYRTNDLDKFFSIIHALSIAAYGKSAQLELSGGNQVDRRRIPSDVPVRLWTSREYMMSPGYKKQMSERKAIPMPGLPGGKGYWKGHGKRWQGGWQRTR